MKTITEAISKLSSNRRLADFLFIQWAGGAALLSNSLVYTLRKPFIAATFDGIEAFGNQLDTYKLGYQITCYLNDSNQYFIICLPCSSMDCHWAVCGELFSVLSKVAALRMFWPVF